MQNRIGEMLTEDNYLFSQYYKCFRAFSRSCINKKSLHSGTEFIYFTVSEEVDSARKATATMATYELSHSSKHNCSTFF